MWSRIMVLVVMVSACGGLWGQRGAMLAEARQLAGEGEVLMREGKYKEALVKLDRAVQLDPGNAGYKIELGRVHYFEGRYVRCMELVGPLKEGRRAEVGAYQLYGNCLDEMGKDYEALTVYREGLKHFPKSGVLYMEMGLLEYARGEDSVALGYWEAGIRAEPNYAGNYYLGAKAHYAQGDYAWAMWMAEVYINLTLEGERLREMSGLIYDACLKARTYDYGGVFQWRFYQGGRQVGSALHVQLDAAFTTALPDTAWTPDIATLGESRRFAAFYVDGQVLGSGASELLRWLQEVALAGHFEAYNYWLLYDARPDDFMEWYAGHEEVFAAFEEWMGRHPLVLRKGVVDEE